MGPIRKKYGVHSGCHRRWQGHPAVRAPLLPPRLILPEEPARGGTTRSAPAARSTRGYWRSLLLHLHIQLQIPRCLFVPHEKVNHRLSWGKAEVTLGQKCLPRLPLSHAAGPLMNTLVLSMLCKRPTWTPLANLPSPPLPAREKAGKISGSCNNIKRSFSFQQRLKHPASPQVEDKLPPPDSLVTSYTCQNP